MNTAEFEKSLRADGFVEIETKGVAAGTHNDAHDHPFDVRAMVLEGSIDLTVDGVRSSYRPGQVFNMKAGCAHVEDVGAQGVRYVFGRRHK